MQKKLTDADVMFRNYQIKKFSIKGMCPSVTMTVDVNVNNLLSLKNQSNERENKPHITITNILVKAVAETLVNYPVLFYFFNKNKIIENKEVVINVPVDVDSHVEYIVIKNPDSKNLDEISKDFNNEIALIKTGKGTYKEMLNKINAMSLFQKIKYFSGKDAKMNFVRRNYGNFPISNFGSFNVKSGTVAISQPIISGLCIGAISKDQENPTMTISLTFDHRPVDGGYAGRFLYDLKNLLENPETIFNY